MFRLNKKLVGLAFIVIFGVLLSLYVCRVWLINKAIDQFSPKTITAQVGEVRLGFMELLIEDIHVQSTEFGNLMIKRLVIRDISQLQFDSVAINKISVHQLSFSNNQLAVKLDEIAILNLALTQESLSIDNIQLTEVTSEKLDNNHKTAIQMRLIKLDDLGVYFVKNQSAPDIKLTRLQLEKVAVKDGGQSDIKIISLDLSKFDLSKKRINFSKLIVNAVDLNLAINQLNTRIESIKLVDFTAIHQNFDVSFIHFSNTVVKGINTHAHAIDHQYGENSVSLNKLILGSTGILLKPSIDISSSTIKMHGINLKALDNTRNLEIETLSLTEFQNQKSITTVETVELVNLLHSPLVGINNEDISSQPYFIKLPAIQLNKLFFTSDLFELDALKVLGGGLKLSRSKSGQLNIIPELAKPLKESTDTNKPGDSVADSSDDQKTESPAVHVVDETATKDSALNAANAKPFFVIHEIILDPAFAIDFSDATTPTPAFINLVIQSFKMSEINSSILADPAVFDLVVSVDDSTAIKAEGYAHPAKVGDFSLHSTFKHLELITVSPYAESSIGYSIDAGQMDLNLDVQAVNSQLNGQADITMRKIDLKPVDKKIADSLTKQLSMPLPTALAILENKKGDVQLKVPIEGDLNDPNFGLRSIINIVTMKALKAVTFTYMKNTLLPSSILIDAASLAAGSIYEKLTAFPPITFEKTQSVVSAANNEILVKVATMMKKKKELTIKVCPVVALDESATEEGRKLIADSRGKAVRDTLTKDGVPTERLMKCKAKTDEKKYSLVYLQMN